MWNESVSITLEELNRQEVIRLVPLMVYLLLIILLGLHGNILVLYVYKKKFGPSNCRTFIIFLSIVDIFTCGIAIPFEILTLLRQYNFKYATLCKLSIVLNTWPTLTSGLLFLSIAVDRYRKVCKPFCWQISHVWAIRLCAINTLIALGFTLPPHLLYGIYSSRHPMYNNITITECAVTADMRNSVYPLINNISFFILFIGALVSICIMYCIIGIKVKAHAKRTSMFISRRQAESVSLDDTTNASEMTIKSGKICESKKSNARENESDALFCSEESTTLNSNPVIELTEREPHIAEMRDIDRQTRPTHKDRTSSDDYERKTLINRVLSVGRYSMHVVSRTFSSASNAGANLVNRKSRKRKADSSQMKTYKTAYIMFLISLAFILSYLPLLCLLLIRSSVTGFVEGLSDQDRTAYKFFLRSYYLNCAINPAIYGFWDARFRKTCKKLLCKRECC